MATTKKTTTPSSSLTDEVTRVAQTIRRGPPPSFESLPEETQREIVAFRDALHAGTLGMTKTSLAKAIEKVLTSRGFRVPKWPEISRKWLDR